MLDWWEARAKIKPEALLVAYGGSAADFEAIAHHQKVFVDDARLRTSDHTRERQSYHGLFRVAANWLDLSPGVACTHIYFAEFDHVPLVPDLNQRQLDALVRESADVLGLCLERIDGSNNPHYLHHAADPAFRQFWKDLTCREDSQIVLNMLGTGSFWTREAFIATANAPEPLPIYLELFLPTTAHHLGYRVRPYPDLCARAHVSPIGDAGEDLAQAEATGAWTIHPVKTLWNRPGA